MAQRHQSLVNYFFIWYVHTRMYGEFLEFFPEFFDLIISINQIFFVKNFQRQFLDNAYIALLYVFMYYFVIFG